MIRKFFYTIFDILELSLLIVLSLLPVWSKSWEAMVFWSLILWVAPVFMILKKITGQFFPGIKIDRYLVPKILVTLYFAGTFFLIGTFGAFFPLMYDSLFKWSGVLITLVIIFSRVMCWVMIMYIWYPPLFAKAGKLMHYGYIIPIILLILLVVIPIYFGSGNQIY